MAACDDVGRQDRLDLVTELPTDLYLDPLPVFADVSRQTPA
jgi:hypothetical protein